MQTARVEEHAGADAQPAPQPDVAQHSEVQAQLREPRGGRARVTFADDLRGGEEEAS